MNILPDISGHDQLVAMEAEMEGIASLSDDELIERIHKTESAGTALYVYAGRMYIELKRRHPGRFTEIIKLQFDHTLDEVEDLMFIAREFPDSSQWRRLPAHKTTLRILARIPREIRDQWIREDKIDVNVTKVIAKELVLEARAESIHGDDGDGCDDSGGDGGHDDVEQDSGDHPEPRTDAQPASQVDVARRNTDTGRDAELERMEAHVEEVQAYNEQLKAENEQLKAEKTCNEREIDTLRKRVAELTAAAGLNDIPIWHQRRQFSYALETAEEADKSKNKLEREQLQKDAGRYVLEIIQSARRDQLDVGLIDLVYRTEPKEITKDKETSFAASAAETQPEQVGI